LDMFDVIFSISVVFLILIEHYLNYIS